MKRTKIAFVFEREFLPRHIKYSSAQIQEQNRQIFVFLRTKYYFSCTKLLQFKVYIMKRIIKINEKLKKKKLGKIFKKPIPEQNLVNATCHKDYGTR